MGPEPRSVRPLFAGACFVSPLSYLDDPPMAHRFRSGRVAGPTRSAGITMRIALVLTTVWFRLHVNYVTFTTDYTVQVACFLLSIVQVACY